MQVTEAYYKWQNEYWTIPGNLLENTTRGYLSIFEHHLLPNIGENNIDAIDLDKIQEYFNSLSKEGYSPKTLRNITQALDSLLSWCWTKRLVKMPINIKQWISFPKKRGGNNIKNTITVNEYKVLLPHLSGHFKYVLQFLAATGIREEEVAILKDSINFEGHYFYVRTAVKRVYTDYKKKKTKLILSDYLKSSASYRIIPMTPDIEEIIHNQLEYMERNHIESDFLFSSCKGTLIDPRNMLRAYHTALEKAHLPQRGLHSLRKMFIYRKARSGMDPKVLQRIVGHEDYATTMKYYMDISEEDTIEEAFKAYEQEKAEKQKKRDTDSKRNCQHHAKG